MSQLDDVEKKINEATKGLPQLPKETKERIAKSMQWVALVVGIFSLWAAYALWHLAHWADRVVELGNALTRSVYGTAAPTQASISFVVWIGIALLAVEGVIYLMAYPSLVARKKAGWNLLFYGALINLVHGVVMLFSSYGGVGRLFSTVLSSAIGMYFLFQIRDVYTGKKAETKTETKK